MYLKVTLETGNSADTLARQLVEDLRSSRQINDAQLVTREALPGEKGIIEELGAVGVSLMGAGGAEVLMFCLRSIFPRMSPPKDGGTQKVRIKRGDEELVFEGDFSDADFRAFSDRVLSLVGRS